MQSIYSSFSFFLISCKSFNKLIEKKLVLQKIQLTPYFSHPALLNDKAKILIFSCYEAKNLHALLIVGTYKYFLNEEFVKRKKID